MANNPIYQAQCFGNVEPIEYMVPYPNLRYLVVGQCIKFSNNILFEKSGLTNSDFLKAVNQYANWLANKGINKGDIVYVNNIPSPEFDILSYAVWSIGAILTISDGLDIGDIKPKFVIDSPSILQKNKIAENPTEFEALSNILLNDDAMIFYHCGQGIILSHYNLLINAYGILKELNILHNHTIQVKISNNTSAYVVLHTILPLYSGTTITDKNSTITFGQDSKSDYIVQFEWDKLSNTKPQSLYVLPEATAILAIGDKPNHLLSITENKKQLKINGHSVMAGYLNKKQNETVFKAGSLVISK